MYSSVGEKPSLNLNLVSVEKLEVSLFHSLGLPTKANAFSFPFDSIGDLRVPIASNGSIDSLNIEIAGMALKGLRKCQIPNMAWRISS